MSLAIIVGRDERDHRNYQWFIDSFYQALTNLQPDLPIEIYPDIKNYNQIDLAMVWRHPPGLLSQFPNLKCIAAMSAGVDHILVDTHLPENIPIVRIVDPVMAREITQYVVANVLTIVRCFDRWQVNQLKKIWDKSPPFNLSSKTVGILGLGFLGQHTADALNYLGLNVIGWSSSAKNLAKIKNFVGWEELPDFLHTTDILVCMLPLTLATKNILNKENLSKLRPGAYVINVGRGEHLQEKDLLSMLDNGHLSGACLDVFQEEPLPANHPFWNHTKIRVTPHIASVTHPETAAIQILENYQRLLTNQPLLNKVDIAKGY